MAQQDSILKLNSVCNLLSPDASLPMDLDFAASTQVALNAHLVPANHVRPGTPSGRPDNANPKNNGKWYANTGCDSE